MVIFRSDDIVARILNFGFLEKYYVFLIMSLKLKVKFT